LNIYFVIHWSNKHDSLLSYGYYMPYFGIKGHS
jgi:hypothetical protein